MCVPLSPCRPTVETTLKPLSLAQLGCSSFDSEWPCIEGLGADILQSRFEAHWASFYNETDFVEMARFGLNTVRIPLGCASRSLFSASRLTSTY